MRDRGTGRISRCFCPNSDSAPFSPKPIVMRVSLLVHPYYKTMNPHDQNAWEAFGEIRHSVSFSVKASIKTRLHRIFSLEKYCVSTLDNLPSGELERRNANKADDATRTLEIVRKLQNLLPSVFPPTGDRPEPSIMVHDDLSSQNILVNESGEFSAVLHWECVSALPVWKACDYPGFLQEKTRHVRPELGNYRP
ncbi:unnamed protein product [Penicillium salamii]|uniref:non-specific serine/threonine protein kinase n=1 Tax=Penicillium salamii TaxID=1612424 RepID=A0A9W4NDS3_9EURO|nr:unnamed protein product [Penicillium salamii]CAG8038915.1 unnamed protein product [Penicillium salamii]CAG8052924.1 unnamed protein product [Penicillium salamii]CAG8323583.1 unnamed protein product [Penicillium salamii]CAG8358203.1 unnamed protein product [Penicillium salamii]